MATIKNYLLLTTVSAILMGNPSSLDAITLDFDTDANGNAIQAGQVIDDEYSPWGVHISTFNFQRSHNLGIAFDSENPTGGDGDLITGPGSYGIGNNPNDPLGNVLIISERSTDNNNDGLIDVPDDEGRQIAGFHRFLFDVDMVGVTMTFLDIEESNGGVLFYLDNSLIASQTTITSGLGDNSRQVLSFDNFTFDEMRVVLGGSGAIDNVTLVPTPEPSTLVLLGSTVTLIAKRMRNKKKQVA